MKKKIVTSIIGTGKQANNWATSVNNNNNFLLKYVSSRNENRGLNFAKEYNCEFISDTSYIDIDF